MVTTPLTISRAKFEPARETAFGAITSSFTRIGTVFDRSFGIIYVQNFTDQILDISVSYAGVDTTFSLAPEGTFAGDMITNQMQISQGESAWVKARTSLPGSGFVQVSTVTPV